MRTTGNGHKGRAPSVVEGDAGAGAGGGVTGGGSVLTTAVGTDSPSSPFLSFTRTRRRNPTSVGGTVYVAALASLMSSQSSGLSALQRRHRYSISSGGSPAASNVALSVCPTTALPWMPTVSSTGFGFPVADPVTASTAATAPITAHSTSRCLIPEARPTLSTSATVEPGGAGRKLAKGRG